MSQQIRPLSTRWREALETIAHEYGLNLEALQSHLRFKAYVEARRECYRYLQSEGWSTPEIGGLFRRDHTTIVVSLLDSDERRILNRERQRQRASQLLGARRVA